MGLARLGARGGAAAVGAGASATGWRAGRGCTRAAAADRRRAWPRRWSCCCPGASGTCARAARSTSPTITAASPRSSAPTRTRRGRTRARSTACSRTSPARSVLDEPHHETDRAAYAMAREWFRFEPRLRAGPRGAEGRSPVRSRAPPALLVDLPARRAGRPPGGLVRRPPRRDRALRGRVRPGDRRAGAGRCRRGRRAPALARCWRWCRSSSRLSRPTRLFFAEPRYRLPIEMLAFPFVALALGEIVAARARGAGDGRAPGLVHAAKALGPALVRRRRLAPRLAGAARRRHRPARAPPLGGDGGRRRRAPPPAAVGAGAAARGAVAAGGIARRRARARRRRRRDPTALRLRLGGGPLPAGQVRASLSAGGGVRRRARCPLAGKTAEAVAGRCPRHSTAEIDHPGGPLALVRRN